MVKPVFYDRFTCIADQCPLTCCQEWKIAVDDTAYERWKRTALPDGRTLSEHTTSRDGQRVIALNKRGRCPFLDEKMLCKLVLAYGDEMLSKTCAVFPREVHEFDDRVECALTPCCPAVIDLLREQNTFVLCETGTYETDSDPELHGDAKEALLYRVRELFCRLIQRETGSVEQNLLVIFYIALDLLEAWEQGESVEEKLALYRTGQALTKLDGAVAEAKGELLFTLEERNELFLDLAVNYRKEGLYQSYLEPAARLAEDLESVYGEEGSREEQEALLQRYGAFERDMQPYGMLFRNLLAGELYAECLLPGYTLQDMAVKLQWIAMEYAVIRQVLFLLWQEEKSISYETIRDEMVVIFRMTGYDDDDIVEYLENSFKSLIWDWGYFALVVGTERE